MDQTVFNITVALCGALGGWVLKVIWDAIKELQGDVRNVDKRMHEDFVRREDFKDAVKELKEDMRIGFDKVDSTLGLLFKKLEAKEDK
jgi:hypothetical protein